MLWARVFGTAEVDAFADWAAAELQKTAAPGDCGAASSKVEARLSKLQARLVHRADAFVAETRLNVYKKAKLGSRLQERLTEAGYPPDFAKDFAFRVTAVVAAADARRS